MDKRQREVQLLVREVVEKEGGAVLSFGHNSRGHMTAEVQRKDGTTRKMAFSTSANFGACGMKNIRQSIIHTMRGINDNSKRPGQ